MRSSLEFIERERVERAFQDQLGQISASIEDTENRDHLSPDSKEYSVWRHDELAVLAYSDPAKLGCDSGAFREL